MSDASKNDAKERKDADGKKELRKYGINRRNKMKNWEFYEEELKKYNLIFAMKDNQICSCASVPCNRCAFNMDESRTCNVAKVKWLYQEHKEPIVLTDDEKALCKLFDRGWIARDKDDSLYWYENKPGGKSDQRWTFRNGSYGDLSLRLNKFFPQCKFDFIRWKDEESWEVKVDD